jgi:hypothetical protein
LLAVIATASSAIIPIGPIHEPIPTIPEPIRSIHAPIRSIPSPPDWLNPYIHATLTPTSSYVIHLVCGENEAFIC